MTNHTLQKFLKVSFLLAFVGNINCVYAHNNLYSSNTKLKADPVVLPSYTPQPAPWEYQRPTPTHIYYSNEYNGPSSADMQRYNLNQNINTIQHDIQVIKNMNLR